jgi:hypothetical protein
MYSFLAIAALAIAACGSRTTPREESGAGTTPPGAPVVAAAPPARSPGGDAAAPPAPAPGDASALPAPSAGDATAPSALPAVATVVPVKPADLQAWLIAGHYRSWAHESKPHESAGPHGDAVKTFVSPSLRASLQAGGAPHPEGAAAVKELYNAAGKHTGWAVSVKVKADSASGKGWYWYEVLSTAPGAKPAYEGVGKELCRDCHTERGSDQVLIPFPLQ